MFGWMARRFAFTSTVRFADGFWAWAARQMNRVVRNARMGMLLSANHRNDGAGGFCRVRITDRRNLNRPAGGHRGWSLVGPQAADRPDGRIPAGDAVYFPLDRRIRGVLNRRREVPR